METKYFINTDLGYQDVSNKIVDDGYTYIDENRLINPKPMIFDYNELKWLRENLYNYVIYSYPMLSSQAFEDIRNISLDNIKSRPYIFTGFFHCLDEDIHLLKLKDLDNKVYNIYLIKYETWSDEEDTTKYGIIKKIRFENEEWYRNFFANETDYNENKYS